MTKMAATSIYDKNPSKFFFSGTSGPISTKLGMWHWLLGLILGCSNDDPILTLAFFTARSNLTFYAFIWGNVLNSGIIHVAKINSSVFKMNELYERNMSCVS